MLDARVPLHDERTPYTRTGAWPVLGTALLVLLLAAGTFERVVSWQRAR